MAGTTLLCSVFRPLLATIGSRPNRPLDNTLSRHGDLPFGPVKDSSDSNKAITGTGAFASKRLCSEPSETIINACMLGVSINVNVIGAIGRYEEFLKQASCSRKKFISSWSCWECLTKCLKIQPALGQSGGVVLSTFASKQLLHWKNHMKLPNQPQDLCSWIMLDRNAAWLIPRRQGVKTTSRHSFAFESDRKSGRFPPRSCSLLSQQHVALLEAMARPALAAAQALLDGFLHRGICLLSKRPSSLGHWLREFWRVFLGFP